MTPARRLRHARGVLAAVIGGERQFFVNSGSMIGTAVVTALLGAAFWLVAARHFTQHAVGVASAAVSAMTLLGFLATVGLGTLLMGELPRRHGEQRGLIDAALIVSAAIGGVLGILFAVLAPHFSQSLGALSESAVAAIAFAVGAALTGAAVVLDQALIGLLRGGLQLARNIAFSLTKLVGLAAVALVVASGSSVWIYSTWTLGIALSMIVLVRFYTGGEDSRRPAFAALRRMRGSAATHHAFNLALRIPDLVLPIIVVSLLSPDANASFYIAWMIASLLFAVPLSLSTVLYAVGSADRAGLAERFRLTLGASMAVGLLANLFLLFAAEPLLSLFGTQYAEQATTPLHLLALGVFPETVRTHYVSVHRIERRIPAAIPIVWGGTLLELAGGACGALVGGLTGVAAGWLIAVCIEAVVMGSDVIRALDTGGGRSATPLSEA
jgi:O-antigen/teichoic acid export membrane protein